MAGIRADAAGERPEAGDCLWAERVVDPGAAPLAVHPAGVAQHLEVMRDRGLADVAAVGEVAGADPSGALSWRRIASRVGSAAAWSRSTSGSVWRFIAAMY